MTENDFPVATSDHYGSLSGNIDLIPKPAAGRIPTIVVGRARQDLSWIAGNTDGWIWHLSNFNRLPQLLEEWRANWPDDVFRPYGYGSFFDLAENAEQPLRYVGNSFSIGRKALLELWKTQEAQGVSHVALNLKPLRRPATDAMQELAEYILPHFPAHGE